MIRRPPRSTPLSLHDALPIPTSVVVAASSLKYGIQNRGVVLGTHLLDRRSEEHTSELQSQSNIVCRLLLEKKTITSLTALHYFDCILHSSTSCLSQVFLLIPQ